MTIPDCLSTSFWGRYFWIVKIFFIWGKTLLFRFAVIINQWIILMEGLENICIKAFTGWEFNG